MIVVVFAVIIPLPIIKAIEANNAGAIISPKIVTIFFLR